MSKCVSIEALLENPNTRPVVGMVDFIESTPPGGKGKRGKMFEVVCDVHEEPVLSIGVQPRKHQAISSGDFGHLISDQHIRLTQRQAVTFRK